MKKFVYFIFAALFVFILASCGDGGYKECKSITADKVSLGSSENKVKVVEYVNNSADVKVIYTTDKAEQYLTTYGNGNMKYNNYEYTKGNEVGEIYISKVVVKYNEKEKKAIKIDETYANISLSRSIYDSMQNNQIFVPTEYISYYIITPDKNSAIQVATIKITPNKVETNYDLSGSASIQYVYA